MGSRRKLRARLAGLCTVPLSGVLLCVLIAGCGKGEERVLPVPPPISPLAARQTPMPAFLTLVPEHPDARSEVRARLDGVPTGAPVRWERVSWFINGAEYQGEGDRLPGGILRRGDLVQAIAELTVDGKRATLMSRESHVRNCPPEVLAATLSDAAPKTGKELRVLVEGGDLDGDPVSFRYRWFLNDKEAEGQSTNALSLEKVGKGTWVHAGVRAFDGTDAGRERFTTKARVANSPPVVEQISITRGEGGYFTANLRVRDADGDPVTIRGTTLPEGVALAETALSWREPALPPGKDASVVLLLSDGDGEGVEYSLRLAPPEK